MPSQIARVFYYTADKVPTVEERADAETYGMHVSFRNAKAFVKGTHLERGAIFLAGQVPDELSDYPKATRVFQRVATDPIVEEPTTEVQSPQPKKTKRRFIGPAALAHGSDASHAAADDKGAVKTPAQTADEPPSVGTQPAQSPQTQPPVNNGGRPVAGWGAPPANAEWKPNT